MHDYFILLFGLFVQPVKDVKDVVTNSIKEATGEALAPVADNTKEVSSKDTRTYQVKLSDHVFKSSLKHFLLKH